MTGELALLESDLKILLDAGDDEGADIILDRMAEIELQQTAADNEPGFMDELGRTAARTGRVIAGAVGGAADIPVLAARGVYALTGDNPDESPILQLPSETLKQGYDYLTDGAGKPQGTVERAADTGAEALVSAGGMARIAGALAKEGIQVTEKGIRSFIDSMGARTTSEAAGTVAGGAAASAAADVSDNPLAPLAAGIAGGAVGAGAANIPVRRNINRVANNGGTRADFVLANEIQESGGINQQRVLDDAERGIPLSLSSENEAVAATSDAVANSGGRAAAMSRRGGDSAFKAMQEETADALDSVTLDDNTPEALSNKFQEGAAAIRNKALQQRRDAANDAYESAVQPGKKVPEGELNKILSFETKDGTLNTSIADTVRRVDSDPLQDLSKIPRNSMTYLDALYKDIGARIRQHDTPDNTKRLLMSGRDKLESLITKYHKEYSDAKDIYASETSLIKEMFGNKKRKTAIGLISEMNADQAGGAAKKLFALQPGRIREIREEFTRQGDRESFDAAVRSYLTGRMEGIIKGDQVNKIVKTDAEYNKLSAAMGKQALTAFNNAMRYAAQVSRSKAYGAGSQTAIRKSIQDRIAREGESRTANVGSVTLRAAVRTAAAVKGLLLPSDEEMKSIQRLMKNDKYANELTSILFEPERGKEFIGYLSSKSASLQEAASLSMFKAALDASAARGAINSIRTEEENDK